MIRPYFRFWMIMSKYQWIFTKLGMCIDIVEIWFGIAKGQISSIFDSLSYLPMTHPYFGFRTITLSKSQRIFTKLDMCIDIVEIWFGIAFGYISSIFDRVISPWHDKGGVFEIRFGIAFWYISSIFDRVISPWHDKGGVFVEIWFGIAFGYISSISDRVISPWHDKGGVFVEIWFGIAFGYISSIFDRVISPWHDNGEILSSHVFFL